MKNFTLQRLRAEQMEEENRGEVITQIHIS